MKSKNKKIMLGQLLLVPCVLKDMARVKLIVKLTHLNLRMVYLLCLPYLFGLVNVELRLLDETLVFVMVTSIN